jgi:serine/threonine protein kinase
LNSDLYCQVGEIALGLKYLHQQWPPIIHGDLRGVSPFVVPFCSVTTIHSKANVLIDSKGRAVVADFGLALIMDSSEFTSIKTAGTCRWTAPEIMNPPNNDDVPLPQFTVKSDIFSYAMTVFEVYLHSLSPCLNTHTTQKRYLLENNHLTRKKATGTSFLRS